VYRLATSDEARSLPYNSAMSHLDILVPFALPPAAMSADLLRELQLPALATLTSRSSAAPPEHLDGFRRSLPHEDWLVRQFGMAAAANSSPPVASALMQSFGLAPREGTWFVVQPVHIHIARDHLVLTDPRQLALAEQEARTLFDIARPLFEENGKVLEYGDAGTWFARADEWTALHTATPDAASGRNIDLWMPTGPGERDWRKVQNEVQMHWFNHPINEQREAHRRKPVNSIWLWGGSGVAAKPQPGGYTHAFNLRGWTQAFACMAPQHAALDDPSRLLAVEAGHGILMLDNLLEPALSNDWSLWLDGMRALEVAWFTPLLQALKEGAIDKLSLVLTHDSRLSHFTASRASLRKFWVKPTLSALCP
jgi:hypothetical protein